MSGSADKVILAVPPYAAQTFLPGLTAPSSFRGIVNAHFKIDPPPDKPPILGVINGTVEWIFAFPGRLSVTISAGDRLVDTPREELAKTIWAQVATVTGLPPGGSASNGSPASLAISVALSVSMGMRIWCSESRSLMVTCLSSSDWKSMVTQ